LHLLCFLNTDQDQFFKPSEYFAHLTARSPTFQDEVKKRGSGRTLSKPRPLGQGAERFTSHSIQCQYCGLML
jgi:hypothetical protein